MPELQKPAQIASKSIGHILWGPSGCGKTTFCATYPGPILWINYDPGGVSALTQFDNIDVLDMVGEPISHVQKWINTDPFGIVKLVREHGYKTIVLDSLTSLQATALRYGVEHASMSPQHAKAGITVEDPGFGGYGRRKTWTMGAVTGLLRLGAALGVNIVFTLHEDSPVMTDDGKQIVYITMTLGSDMPETAALHVSEVWYMRDHGGKREMLLRPAYMRRPMKSRMFDTRQKGLFVWDYDALTHKGLTMASLIDDWREAGYTKLLPP